MSPSWPARGWALMKRAYQESRQDRVPLLAAGVAFYAFLALFPTLIALVMLYGLVFDPAQVTDQIQSLSGSLPEGVRSLLTDQLNSLAATPRSTLGLGLAISVAAALCSASSGIGHLVMAVNMAYDVPEQRGFVSRKLLALGPTFGALVFFAIMLTLVAVVPAVLDNVLPAGPVQILAQAVRWLLVVVCAAVALAVVYRLAPDRDGPRIAWVSIGAGVAILLWVVASVGFSIYVDNFGKYAKTYGALAGVAILMLWLWISSYAVLLGAEINAESERQARAP